jgi:hypothetical protein
MLLFLLLCLLTAGFFIEIFQKHILKMRDPDIHQLWAELENEEWFQKLNDIPDFKKWIELDKQNGLLKDPYYVRKIIDQGGHREGYIRYIIDKTK